MKSLVGMMKSSLNSWSLCSLLFNVLSTRLFNINTEFDSLSLHLFAYSNIYLIKAPAVVLIIASLGKRGYLNKKVEEVASKNSSALGCLVLLKV